MKTSGKDKRPANPATIQSDAAGNPDKPIYQEEEDVHHSVPADEDRDPLPYSEDKSAGKEGEGDSFRRDDEKEPGQKPRPPEEKPKDDVHSAPESGDKLP